MAYPYASYTNGYNQAQYGIYNPEAPYVIPSTAAGIPDIQRAVILDRLTVTAAPSFTFQNTLQAAFTTWTFTYAAAPVGLSLVVKT